MSNGLNDHNKPHSPTAKTATWVCVGSLGTAHGVKGDMKIRSFTDDKNNLAEFAELFLGEGHNPVSLHVKFANKDGFVASVSGIKTREEAMSATGQKLYVKREQLPEPDKDDFYITDIVGLKVQDLNGEEIGIVKAVQNFGAGDVLEISLQEARKPVGREVMISFQKQYVPEVDIEGKYIAVDFAGWLDSLSESAPKKGKE